MKREFHPDSFTINFRFSMVFKVNFSFASKPWKRCTSETRKNLSQLFAMFFDFHLEANFSSLPRNQGTAARLKLIKDFFSLFHFFDDFFNFNFSHSSSKPWNRRTYEKVSAAINAGPCLAGFSETRENNAVSGKTLFRRDKKKIFHLFILIYFRREFFPPFLGRREIQTRSSFKDEADMRRSSTSDNTASSSSTTDLDQVNSSLDNREESSSSSDTDRGHFIDHTEQIRTPQPTP